MLPVRSNIHNLRRNRHKHHKVAIVAGKSTTEQEVVGTANTLFAGRQFFLIDAANDKSRAAAQHGLLHEDAVVGDRQIEWQTSEGRGAQRIKPYEAK